MTLIYINNNMILIRCCALRKFDLILLFFNFIEAKFVSIFHEVSNKSYSAFAFQSFASKAPILR